MVLYQALKKLVGMVFHALNFLMAGNLPPFGCVCVLVEREEHFLVVELSNGSVVFPGGFMRWSESPEETLQREGMEETGLLIRGVHLVGYYPHVAENVTQMSTLTLVYAGEVVGGALRKSIEGHPLWLATEALPGRLAPDYHTIFADYLRYRAEHGEEHTNATGTHATTDTFYQS